jgi:hypothetical protein
MAAEAVGYSRLVEVDDSIIGESHRMGYLRHRAC